MYNSPSVQVFWPALFVCLATLSVSNFGLYYLVEFYKTGVLNKLVFFTWLALVIVPPSLYYAIKAEKEHRHKKDLFENYVDLSLTIFHFNDFPVYIEAVKFTNTKNGREVNVKLPKTSTYYLPEELQKLELRDKLTCQEPKEFSDNIDIPLGSDQFFISYYSFLEERYYSDTFQFDFDKYTETNKYTGKKWAKSLEVFLLPDAKVDVIVKTDTDLKLPYFDVKFEPVDQKKKEELKSRLNIANLSDSSAKTDILEQIKASGRLEKMLEMYHKQFTWHLSIQSPGEVKAVHVRDIFYFDYESSYRWASTSSKKHLPSEISFYLRNSNHESFAQVYFFIDPIKLSETISTLTAGNDTTSIELSISVADLKKENIALQISSGNSTLSFRDFALNVVNYESVGQE